MKTYVKKIKTCKLNGDKVKTYKLKVGKIKSLNPPLVESIMVGQTNGSIVFNTLQGGNGISITNNPDNITVGLDDTIIFNNLTATGTVIFDRNVHSNTSIGDYALGKMTQGNLRNIAIGDHSGENIGSSNINNANDNIMIGYQSGQSITIGDKNIMMGTNSGTEIIDGDNNVAIGYNSGNKIKSGNNNTTIGYNSGDNIVSGNSNVIIGSDSGTHVNMNLLNNVILLGANISGSDTTHAVSNSAIIGNSLDKCYIDAKSTTFNGKLVPHNGSGLISIGGITGPSSSTTNILVGNGINAQYDRQ